MHRQDIRPRVPSYSSSSRSTRTSVVNLKYYFPVIICTVLGSFSSVPIKLNHPKSFRILCMLLYDFGGFRLVECSYHLGLDVSVLSKYMY